MSKDPLSKTKEEYSDIVEKIQSDSPVGIDAQYTHAVIIEYLQHISKKLEDIEQKIK